MANRKIPEYALFFYVGLGPGRSYQQVADHYGVTKRAVVNLAVKERWQEQVEKLESEARETAQVKARTALEAADERHMKALRLVFGKGIEALRNMAIDSPADAMAKFVSVC